jgi:hypothetical protein
MMPLFIGFNGSSSCSFFNWWPSNLCLLCDFRLLHQQSSFTLTSWLFFLDNGSLFFFGRWAADAALEIYNQQFLSISPVIIIF